ncbi:hypothetical protein Naga_102930g1, partial [Nannochloropsis gaditana]
SLPPSLPPSTLECACSPFQACRASRRPQSLPLTCSHPPSLPPSLPPAVPPSLLPDLLFIPEGWWHQVTSGPQTIAVNYVRCFLTPPPLPLSLPPSRPPSLLRPFSPFCSSAFLTWLPPSPSLLCFSYTPFPPSLPSFLPHSLPPSFPPSLPPFPPVVVRGLH